MKPSAAKRVAYTGMLFALAIALSWLEGQVAGLLALPPGVKLGLANTVVMYALFFIGPPTALVLVGLKAGFALLTRGAMAGLLSGAGGLLSFMVMALLLKLAKNGGLLIFSVAGAVAHNLGQLLVVWLWFGQNIWYYAPVLLVTGIAMGCLTAALLRALLPALGQLGLARPRAGPKAGLPGQPAQAAQSDDAAKNENPP